MATTAVSNNQNTAVQAKDMNRKRMKALIANPELIERMQNMLGQNAGTFLASVLDLYTSDSILSECNPNEVMQEAMKAAALHLPVVKSLGFAYIVPFKDKKGIQRPNFILGYKGYIQLCMRTGHYKTINAGAIYEGETVIDNRITGEVRVEGKPTSDKPIGYFAHISTINGFEKTEYWSKERVVRHASAKSKSWKRENSPWHTDFDAMAEKTLIRHLLSRYAEMSVDIMTALASDSADDRTDNEAPANGAEFSLPTETETVIDVTEDSEISEPAEEIPAETAPANDNPAPKAAKAESKSAKQAQIGMEDFSSEVPF